MNRFKTEDTICCWLLAREYPSPATAYLISVKQNLIHLLHRALSAWRCAWRYREWFQTKQLTRWPRLHVSWVHTANEATFAVSARKVSRRQTLLHAVPLVPEVVRIVYRQWDCWDVKHARVTFAAVLSFNCMHDVTVPLQCCVRYARRQGVYTHNTPDRRETDQGQKP